MCILVLQCCTEDIIMICVKLTESRIFGKWMCWESAHRRHSEQAVPRCLEFLCSDWVQCSPQVPTHTHLLPDVLIVYFPRAQGCLSGHWKYLPFSEARLSFHNLAISKPFQLYLNFLYGKHCDLYIYFDLL